MTVLQVRGCTLYKTWLDATAQAALTDRLQQIIRQAPFFAPLTPRGKPMSVRMTAAGRFGWYSDSRGYRYIDRHPDGTAWPPIPEEVLAIWRALSGVSRLPECCLINHYTDNARMGMHQDRDEADFSMPVLSVSLGDAALFRIGNTTRGGRTESVWLESGDVLVMGGEARLTYHGVDRIRSGSSSLLAGSLPGAGRLNLTLRVVT